MKKLTKKQVIIRLQKTVKKLKALPNYKFNYGSYVYKSKELKDGSTCGTVCCTAGWYPLWFPDAGLIWNNHNLESNTKYDIDKTLARYHGINIRLVNVLFLGMEDFFDSKRYKFIKCYIGFEKNVSNVKRDEVIQLFEMVINLIKKDEIDYC